MCGTPDFMWGRTKALHISSESCWKYHWYGYDFCLHSTTYSVR